jgi:hypothetical protein
VIPLRGFIMGEEKKGKEEPKSDKRPPMPNPEIRGHRTLGDTGKGSKKL